MEPTSKNRRRAGLVLAIACTVTAVVASCGRGPTATRGDNVANAQDSSPTRPTSHAREPEPPIGSHVVHTEAEWRRLLTAEQFHILREAGTEPPFQNAFHDDHRAGTFLCGGCGAPLFDSRDKFDSGTGWPSFTRAIEPGRVAEIRDASLGMVRIEVRCDRCGGHLGHVFPDGPAPTHLRYCINSGALELRAR